MIPKSFLMGKKQEELRLFNPTAVCSKPRDRGLGNTARRLSRLLSLRQTPPTLSAPPRCFQKQNREPLRADAPVKAAPIETTVKILHKRSASTR